MNMQGVCNAGGHRILHVALFPLAWSIIMYYGDASGEFMIAFIVNDFDRSFQSICVRTLPLLIICLYSQLVTLAGTTSAHRSRRWCSWVSTSGGNHHR